MTTTELNPQGEQMADESMIRNLAAQIEAIWPQEKRLVDLYHLPRNPRVLDVGAGTGEFGARFAQAFPDASVLGVELLPASVEYARKHHAALERCRCGEGDERDGCRQHEGVDLPEDRIHVRGPACKCNHANGDRRRTVHVHAAAAEISSPLHDREAEGQV
jgi:SAM-dependent methyltransferase